MCFLYGPPQEFRSDILIRINSSKLDEETDAHFSCLDTGGIRPTLYAWEKNKLVRDFFSRLTESIDKFVFHSFSFACVC